MSVVFAIVFSYGALSVLILQKGLAILGVIFVKFLNSLYKGYKLCRSLINENWSK